MTRNEADSAPLVRGRKDILTHLLHDSELATVGPFLREFYCAFTLLVHHAYYVDGSCTHHTAVLTERSL